MSLNLGDEVLLLLLARVHDGHVTQSFDHYFDDDRRIWRTVTLAFRTLTETGPCSWASRSRTVRG